jgi:hypothetical protein
MFVALAAWRGTDGGVEQDNNCSGASKVRARREGGWELIIRGRSALQAAVKVRRTLVEMIRLWLPALALERLNHVT